MIYYYNVKAKCGHVGKALSVGASKVSKAAQRVATKLPSKLTKGISKMIEPLKKIGNSIGNGINKLKAAADKTIFHSKYIGKKIFFKNLSNLIANNPEGLKKQSIDSLRKSGLLDKDGNSIDVKQLEVLFDQVDEGEIGEYIINGEVVKIVKQNGVVGLKYNDEMYQSVKLLKKSFSNTQSIDIRNENLKEAAGLYKQKWIDDPSSCPEEIAKVIRENYPDISIKEALQEMSNDTLRTKIIGKSTMVMHENIDLETVTLVSREVHDKVHGYNGPSHMGGVGLEKYVKQHMGSIYFETLVSAAASGGAIVGGNIAA